TSTTKQATAEAPMPIRPGRISSIGHPLPGSGAESSAVVALDRHLDPHVVADRPDHALHAEVAALDVEGRQKPRRRAAAGHPRALARLLDLEGQRPGHPVEGQVAGYVVGVLARRGDRLAPEADRRELPDVEEVGALEVPVTLRAAGVEAVGP